MKEINLKVEGMMCTGCENRIQNAVKNMNGSDNGSEGIGNGRPGVDEKVPDSGNNSREKGSNAVPCVHKKCLDGSPDFVPACSEPSQHHICNAFQSIHDIAERVDNEIPDRRKNPLDAVPALLPVAGK